MKQTVLESIEGVSIYPIISLIIFFTLFLGVIIYAFRMDKNFVKEVSQLPLNNDDPSEEDESSKESAGGGFKNDLKESQTIPA